MDDDTVSTNDLKIFVTEFGRVIEETKSLDDIEDWLRSQPYIVSVKTASYLIKTEPPKKELIVTFRFDSSSTVTKVIDITVYPDQTFSMSGMHGQ